MLHIESGSEMIVQGHGTPCLRELSSACSFYVYALSPLIHVQIPQVKCALGLGVLGCSGALVGCSSQLVAKTVLTLLRAAIWNGVLKSLQGNTI